MAKPNLSVDESQCYVVLDDDDTFSSLSGCTVLIVDGDFDSGNDSAVSGAMQGYDLGMASLEVMKTPIKDALVPVEVTTDDNEHVSVRAISVEFLLNFYMENRNRRANMSIVRPTGRLE